MGQRDRLSSLIRDINENNIINFFREAHDGFRPETEDLSYHLKENEELLSNIKQLGVINYKDEQRLIVLSGELTKEINNRSSKKRQYEIARKILKSEE